MYKPINKKPGRVTEILGGCNIYLEGRMDIYGGEERVAIPFMQNYMAQILYGEIKNKASKVITFVSTNAPLDFVDERGANLWHHIIKLKNDCKLGKKTFTEDIYKNNINAFIHEINEFGRAISRNDRTLHTKADNNGITPMMLAYQLNDIDSMKILFGLGEDPNIVFPDAKDRTLFQEALDNEKIEILGVLLSKCSLKTSKEQIEQVYKLGQKEPSLSGILRPHAKKMIEKKLEKEGSAILKEEQNKVSNLNNNNEINKNSALSSEVVKTVDSSNKIKPALPPRPYIQKPLVPSVIYKKEEESSSKVNTITAPKEKIYSALYPIPQVSESTIMNIHNKTVLNNKSALDKSVGFSSKEQNINEKPPLPPRPTESKPKLVPPLPPRKIESKPKLAPELFLQKNVTQQSVSDSKLSNVNSINKGIVNRNIAKFQPASLEPSFAERIRLQKENDLKQESRKR
ncbi:hypothetical protein NOVO_07085 [Rickettsiales bacterium Ac37b]|nr:hypothetical protein NOVO_07085 [Rickettsiales bacterium Ac37b]